MMIQTQSVRVQEKGQVTIPLEVRKKLGLKKGDRIVFIETESGIVIKPAVIIASETLDAMGMALRDKGVTLDDLLQSGRKSRRRLLEAQYPSVARRKRT